MKQGCLPIELSVEVIWHAVQFYDFNLWTVLLLSYVVRVNSRIFMAGRLLATQTVLSFLSGGCSAVSTHIFFALCLLATPLCCFACMKQTYWLLQVTPSFVCFSNWGMLIPRFQRLPTCQLPNKSHLIVVLPVTHPSTTSRMLCDALQSLNIAKPHGPST